MERREGSANLPAPPAHRGDGLFLLALGAAGLLLALLAGTAPGEPTRPVAVLLAPAAVGQMGPTPVALAGRLPDLAAISSGAPTSETGRPVAAPAIPRRLTVSVASSASEGTGLVQGPAFAGAGSASPPVVTSRLVRLGTGALQTSGEIEVGPLLTGLDQSIGRSFPPDVQVAVGPSAIVELVNTAGRIWDRTGAVRSTFRLGDLVGRVGDSLSDPRILFDASSGRWLATVMNVSRLEVDLAVSQTADPSGSWYTYALPANGSCPDQPKVGVADGVVTVTANLFDGAACSSDQSGPPPFIGSQVWVVNKAQLLAGGWTSWQVFGPYPDLAGLTPAQSLGPSPTAYLVSAGSNLSTSTLAVLSASGIPPATVTLSRWNVSVWPLAVPPQSRQAGSSVLLDTGDLRVQDATYRDGILALTIPEGCTPPGDATMEPCARVMEISLPAGTVTTSGRIAFAGTGVLYPVGRPDGAGNLDLVVGYSSPTDTPSLAVTTLRADGTWSDATYTLAVGAGLVLNVPPGQTDSRYGDYFGAALDPTDPGRVWVAGELGGTGGTWQTALSWIRYAGASGSSPAPSPGVSPSPSPSPSPPPTPSPSPSPAPSPTPTTPILFTVTQGESATLRVSGPPSTTATLEASADGSVWTPLAVVTTDATGQASYTLVPTATAFYRVTFPGEAPVLLGQGVVLPPETTALTVAPSRSVITWGESVTLSVSLASPGTAADGRLIDILASRDGVSWSTVARLTTGLDGRASLAYRPATNLWYRAVFAGASDLPAGTSPPARVVVRQIALLRPTNGGTVRTVARGTTVTFTVTVRPARPELPPARVTFVAYRWVGGRWTPVVRVDQLVDGSGRATWSWRFSSVGSWYVRAIANPTPYNANSLWSPPEWYAVR
jgi:hypothetical protein